MFASGDYVKHCRDLIMHFAESASLHASGLDLPGGDPGANSGWILQNLQPLLVEGHSMQVVETTVRLALKMGVPEAELVHIRRGALLHDIGKIAIPTHILLKPGKLSEEEWDVMRQHPVHAYEILSPIPFLQEALDIPYCHHEHWDGSGYPNGLKGEAIPLAARIFAVVDVWDALLSDRPYRKSWKREEALDYIMSEAGRYFDPQVVEAFLDIQGEKFVGDSDNCQDAQTLGGPAD